MLSGLGQFFIVPELMADEPDHVGMVLSQVLIKSIAWDPYRQVYVFIAESPFFDPVETEGEVPIYNAVFRTVTDGDNRTTTFECWSRYDPTKEISV